MKRRIIKGLLGIGGVRRSAQYDYLTQDPTSYLIKPLPEDAAQEAYLQQHDILYDEPWWSKAFRYVQNPFDLASDYIQESEWAPDWLKEFAPWASFGLAMAAPGKPKNGPGRGNPGVKRVHKGQQATKSLETKNTGLPRGGRKVQDIKDLIEAGGDPFDDSSGAMRMKDGDVTYLGTRGRQASMDYTPSPLTLKARLWFANKVGNTQASTQLPQQQPQQLTTFSRRKLGRPTAEQKAIDLERWAWRSGVSQFTSPSEAVPLIERWLNAAIAKRQALADEINTLTAKTDVARRAEVERIITNLRQAFDTERKKLMGWGHKVDLTDEQRRAMYPKASRKK